LQAGEFRCGAETSDNSRLDVPEKDSSTGEILRR
jgi:hypothetical protein